jgi:hypothetical protein
MRSPSLFLIWLICSRRATEGYFGGNGEFGKGEEQDKAAYWGYFQGWISLSPGVCSRKVFGPNRQGSVLVVEQASMAKPNNMSIATRAGFTC